MRTSKLAVMLAGAVTLAAMLAAPSPAVAQGSARPDPAHSRHSGVIRLVPEDAGKDAATALFIECLWYIEPPFANADRTIQTFVQVECDNLVDRIDITVIMYENYVVRTIRGDGRDAVSGFLLPSTPVPCHNGSGYFGAAYVSVQNAGFFVDDSGYSVLNVFFC